MSMGLRRLEGGIPCVRMDLYGTRTSLAKVLQRCRAQLHVIWMNVRSSQIAPCALMGIDMPNRMDSTRVLVSTHFSKPDVGTFLQKSNKLSFFYFSAISASGRLSTNPITVGTGVPFVLSFFMSVAWMCLRHIWPMILRGLEPGQPNGNRT